MKKLFNLLLISCVVACSSSDMTRPLEPDIEKLFWRVEVNHPAVILSVHKPYDTVQLRVIARNIYGDSLPVSERPSFRNIVSVDTSVSIDSNGLITAKVATPAARIEVTLTSNGITHTDTSIIMVRNESPIRFIDSLTFRPNPYPADSNWRWVGYDIAATGVPGLGLTRWLKIFSGGSDITFQALAAYSYENSDLIACPHDGSGIACNVMGETYIRAYVYAYGKRLLDSTLFKRVTTTAKYVVLKQMFPITGDKTVEVFPSIITVSKGTTVFFFNRGMVTDGFFAGEHAKVYNPVFGNVFNTNGSLLWVDSVDIVFDKPEAVEPGISFGSLSHALAFNAVNLENWTPPFSTDGNPGNIQPFGHVRDPNASFIFDLDQGWKSRSFSIPGTYHYTSTRFPNIKGTIVVTE